MNVELMKKIDSACSTAEEFTRVYYGRMDKGRHQIGKLYLESAELVWNGNGVSGADRIQSFLVELPASEHTLTALDAQPVVGPGGGAVEPPPSVLVQTSGRLKRAPPNDAGEVPFHQTFLVTAQGDKWKIVSDCFRTVPNES